MSVFFLVGIGGASGAAWKERRKMALGILRRMGMGSNVMAAKIQEEVTHFLQAVADLGGKPTDFAELINVSVSNNICSIIWGRRFNYDHPQFVEYLQMVEHIFSLIKGQEFGLFVLLINIVLLAFQIISGH